MSTLPHVELVYNRRHTATTTKEATVELRVSFRKEQKYMSTGIKLLPKHWHRGKVVNRADATQLNKTFDKIIVDVRTVIYNMVEEGHIDIFSIPERLNQLRVGNMDFFEFCEKRAEIRSFGKSKDNQERYSRFVKFLREWGGIEYWTDITEQKIIDLDEYLTKKKMKPYSKWQNYHRFLNSFILDAQKEGLVKRNPYNWLNIDKDKTSKSLDKCLTPEEFERVKTAEMPTDRLQRVRDLFVFQTYTCMAIADLKAFDRKKIQEIKGMKVYVAQRVKGHGQYGDFTVPLLPPALEILKKYRNKLPLISDQKYNDYLKLVAQAAGINKPITSHWARHTGATILLNGGTPMQIVSKILGHTSTRITEQIYAKLLDETVVDAMVDYQNNNKPNE